MRPILALLVARSGYATNEIQNGNCQSQWDSIQFEHVTRMQIKYQDIEKIVSAIHLEGKIIF